MRPMLLVSFLVFALQVQICASVDSGWSPYRVEYHFYDSSSKTKMTLTVDMDKESRSIRQIRLKTSSYTIIVPKCAYADLEWPLIDTAKVYSAAVTGETIIGIDAAPVGNTYPKNIRNVRFYFSVKEHRYTGRIVVEGEGDKEVQYGQPPCGT